MAKLRHLTFHTIFYFFANSIEALTPIVMIPVLTRYLAPHEYGLWVLFQATVAFLVPIIGLSFKDAIRMRFFELNSHEFSCYINCAVAISFTMSLVALCIATEFRQLLAEWLDLRLVGLMMLIFIATLYSFFYTTLAVCQFSGERKKFLWMQCFQTIISVSASLTFVISGMGWKGCVLGRLTGLICVSIVSAIWLYRRFKCCNPLRAGKQYLSSLIRFGIHYLPSGLLSVVIPLTNRVLIAHNVSIAEASLYAIAESFAMGLYLVVNGFMHAWNPWLFRKLAGNDEDGLQNVFVSCVLFIVGLPIAGTLMALAGNIAAPFLLGHAFEAATSFIFAMMMVVSALGFFLLMLSFMHFKQRTGLMSLCSLVAITINVILNTHLVKHFGAAYIPWGTVFSYCLAGVMAMSIDIFLYRRFIWRKDTV